MSLAEKLRTLRAELQDNASKPNRQFFKKLESSVKKNAGYVKRLKILSTLPVDQIKTMVEECRKLNLSRYTAEIVNAIETQCDSFGQKTREELVWFIEICVVMHRYYRDDFDDELIPKIEEMKPRIALKLLAEFFIVGIIEETDPILTILQQSIKNEKDQGGVLNTISILTSFAASYGDHFFQYENPTEEQTVLPFRAGQEDSLVTPEESSAFLRLYQEYFEILCQRMGKGMKKMKEVENDMNQQEEYEKMRKSWLKFYNITFQFSQYINLSIPDEIRDEMKRLVDILNGIRKAKEQTVITDQPLFEIESDLEFYQEIPSIQSFIPNDIEVEANIELAQAKMDDLLSRLNKITSRSHVDRWIIDFGPCNNKLNQKKVARAMFHASRNQMELLCYFSRIVAIFNAEHPDFCQFLKSLLHEEFYSLIKRKDQGRIESKIKNIKFIGELTKFDLIKPLESLKYVQDCLNDFAPHNINVVSAFFETCGRYLYLHPASQKQIKAFLEQMMRFKRLKSLDSNFEMLIDNAVYACITPQKAHRSDMSKFSPLMQYTIYLLQQKLDRKNVLYIVKKIRMYDWSQPSTQITVLNSLDTEFLRFDKVHLFASVIKGLDSHLNHVVTLYVDNLIENIRASLAGEVNLSHQRRILDVKILGELFVHSVVEDYLIMNILYMFIRYSPKTDSDHDSFRIRLVCTLLDSTVQYFKRGARKKLDYFIMYLQNYVLQKKYRLPVDVEFMMAESLEQINRKMKWPKNLAQSIVRIQNFESKTSHKFRPQPKADAVFPISKKKELKVSQKSDEEEDYEDNFSISTMAEEEEKKIKQQMEVEKRLQNMRFDREIEQIVQQDISKRRVSNKITNQNDIEQLGQTKKLISFKAFGNNLPFKMLKK